MNQPINLALFFGLLGFLPMLVVLATAYTKIVIVLILLRNALGLQQVPPNIAINSFAMVLTAFVMMPALHESYAALSALPSSPETVQEFLEAIAVGGQPIKHFMARNIQDGQVDFFLQLARRIWPPAMVDDVRGDDFIVVLPAFAMSELTVAFQIGVLLFLPFAVIDLIVQAVLLALGMMMMSPMTISLPLKILLFVLVEGWTRLISSILLSYH